MSPAALLAAVAIGMIAGLLLAMALLPDLPDRILVPVPQQQIVQTEPPEVWV